MLTSLIFLLLFPQFVNNNVVQENDDKRRYQVSNEAFIQRVEVEWISDNKISFVYEVINRSVNDTISISGEARNPYPDSAPEIDYDSKTDESYPSVEYLYQTDDCQIYFRIEDKNPERIIVLNEGCKQYTDNHFPIEAIGTLRLTAHP